MPDRKVVAIHQPNFFPWLGYFEKFARADVFVMLDNVQFPKKGATWSNRVHLLVEGRPQWMTMPIVRAYHGVRGVNEMEIDNTSPWRSKLLKTLELNYKHAPHFSQVFPVVAELVKNPTSSLAEYNRSAIESLAIGLGLDTSKLVLSSRLEAEGQATDLLIAIVQSVGGTAYLCGGGATGYQEDTKFAAAGLELIYQDLQHPVYPQKTSGEFVPGLSVIDALMHCSFRSTGAMIGAARSTR